LGNQRSQAHELVSIRQKKSVSKNGRFDQLSDQANMHYHRAIRDQTDPGVLRQQTKTDDQGILESLEIFLVQTGIDNVKEDGWNLSLSIQIIFDGGILWKQFSRQVGVGNVLVMRRESITLQTEWANPHFGAHIYLADIRLKQNANCSSAYRYIDDDRKNQSRCSYQ
jgi:hypothetical protein